MKQLKKLGFTLLIGFVMAAFFPACTQAEAESDPETEGLTPVIAIQEVPKYGEDGYIRGYVFTEDDSDFNSKYIIDTGE